MKAIVVVDAPGGATLSMRQVAPPEPGPTELLVRIRAAGVNRTDLRRVQQHYNSGRLHIAGLEMSGEVIGMGGEVGGFRLGDRVMSQANGCYAEQVCVDHRLALKIPEGLSFEAAAAVPVTFVTAHDALVSAGKLERGSSVLVHAVTSGIGISAIQVASLLGASTILGTTRDPAKTPGLQALGLDAAIDVSGAAAFADQVLSATQGTGVDVIADTVGGGALADNLRAAALGGRVVSIGRMGGMTDTIDLDLLALRRVSLIGVTFRSRTLEEKRAVNDRFLSDLGRQLASGELRPIVDRTFSLEDALEAQEHMRSDAHLGKIVLLP